MHTAVYIRVSKQEQRQDSQLKELKNYYRLRGWKDVTLYTEKESGAKVARPELDRLMSDVRAGHVERVICYKLDRLGRSVMALNKKNVYTPIDEALAVPPGASRAGISP